jgi:hypothetical protein
MSDPGLTRSKVIASTIRQHYSLKMKPDLNQLDVVPKHGNEPFHAGNDNLGFTLKDFWTWGVSDLVVNLMRGHLAEFIVADLLGNLRVLAGRPETWVRARGAGLQ